MIPLINRKSKIANRKSRRLVSVIGSTGSIGVNALEVIGSDPSWSVAALACGQNANLLARQIKIHKPRVVSVADDATARRVYTSVWAGRKPPLRILVGEEGLKAAATIDKAEIIVVGISGAAGLVPTWEAVKAGKKVALANKEAIVLAGHLIIEKARKTGAEIIPVDSEHSAVFQLMLGVNTKDVKKIWLGASGGPFRNLSQKALEKVTPKQALAHPVWKMGKRITVDSATLLNKGLEIIEACRLFGVTEERVGVFVHPQGLVHAMVELNDGVMLAHVSRPDMKGPIAYALGYPERAGGVLESPDLFNGKGWTFEPADAKRFPCLELARKAARAGGTMPAVLNGADEVAVDAFLNGKCGFTDIPRVIEAVMKVHKVKPVNEIKDALDADEWAREEARRKLVGLK